MSCVSCDSAVGDMSCVSCDTAVGDMSCVCVTDCPVCYNLVQDRVNIHRRKLHELRMLIRQINDNPKVVDDSEFRAKLDATAATVDDLLEKARRTGG